MDQIELRTLPDHRTASLEREGKELLQARLESLASVFPFNEYEYTTAFLVDRNVISFSEYEAHREKFVSSSRYFDLFSLAPRSFGQGWGEKHLINFDDGFQRVSKTLDPKYVGQYDHWIRGIWVEGNAARAIDNSRGGQWCPERSDGERKVPSGGIFSSYSLRSVMSSSLSVFG